MTSPIPLLPSWTPSEAVPIPERPVGGPNLAAPGLFCGPPSRLPTPQVAIRRRCLDCRETMAQIEACEFGPKVKEPCSLWQFRMGSARRAGSGSRIKAIRRYCLWCMCGQSNEVKLCPCKPGTIPESPEICALWPYRLGHRPKVEAVQAELALKG